ncbi:DNA cytosine methyltransferase [Anabaena sp. FACHB-1237]|uniref:DNA cytosine methyltransferase n=1 Tax=Anabaena sp. FACHB-1237 TaxID=2692769 RepID=UPI001F558DF5|nr:DNA cytosine methyltransferase [Anabaena sp. FACHB-1237]
MIKNKLKAIELFAGIGGFHLGLKNANIETIWANDINELSCHRISSINIRIRKS